jgi:hypothetical protein
MPVVRILPRPVKNDQKFFEIPSSATNPKTFAKNISQFNVHINEVSPTKSRINYQLLTSKAQKSLA